VLPSTLIFTRILFLPFFEDYNLLPKDPFKKPDFFVKFQTVFECEKSMCVIYVFFKLKSCVGFALKISV